MKNGLLILILALISLSAYPQINSYFENNPVWKIHYINGSQLPCLEHIVYNYYISGDTVINSFTYKKILKKGEWYYTLQGPPPYPNCPPYSTINDTNAFLFIRSVGKELYFRFANDTSEHFLYNFNLNIGDTLPLSYTNFTNDIVVIGIDSIYTPYGYLKRFDLSFNSSMHDLIEGIGSTSGLIEPINIPIGAVWDLECYSLNDTSYFPLPGLDCEVIIGIDEIKSEINFSVYPNPFTDHLIIKKEINDKLIFKMYNSEGKLIECKFINIGIEEIKFEMNLDCGFYFYSVTDEKGKIRNGKLIKN